MVIVYLEKHGKVLVGALEDDKSGNIVDYLSDESKGSVLRKESVEIFSRAKEKVAG